MATSEPHITIFEYYYEGNVEMWSRVTNNAFPFSHLLVCEGHCTLVMYNQIPSRLLNAVYFFRDLLKTNVNVQGHFTLLATLHIVYENLFVFFLIQPVF